MPLTVHVAPVVLPICDEPIRPGAVAVSGDRIVAVGTPETVLAAHAPDAPRIRRWSGVLTPGLVNAHAHLQYTDFADLADGGLAFPVWIRQLTARRAAFTDTAWQESTRHGIHALLRSGTTAVADIVTDAPVLLPSARSGLAGVSYVEAVAADAARWTRQSRTYVLAALHGAPAGRAVGVSPHTLYTLGTEVFRDCLTIAREQGLRVHTHLAETPAEVEYVCSGTGPFAETARLLKWDFELLRDGGSGRTPARELDALGGLHPRVHVAHGVHCDAADRALLRERGVSVALCTRSNAILGAGVPPVAAYLAEGSPIAVGTDSLASSPSLDLWAEVAALAVVAQAQGYDGPDLDRRLVEAATVGGAVAMGLADTGVLRPGARADLAVFDVPTGSDAGGTDPYTALVRHGAGRCLATVLAGRLVHRA